MTLVWRSMLALALGVAVATPALAQGPVITGVVRDSSGAVLPGVTVEAASPVLIEKVRSVVSDGTGQYRIVDLRPGVYAVTFTLTGFNTFVRDGIELTGNFTATVNAEMRVGALSESITVTGESPVVDVQGVSHQQALSADVIQAVPTGRNYTNLGVLVPGISTQCAATCDAGSQDVGGMSGDSRAALTVHGSRFRDQRIAISGMTISGSTGGLTVTGPNMEAMQEVQLETSSADASTSTGGVRINVVPKDGGNAFAGSVFFSATNEHLQGDNVTQEILDRGLRGTVPRVKKLYDIAPTFGGPIRRDKVWFFVNVRRAVNENYVGNLYENRNAYDPKKFTYEPDLSKELSTSSPLTPVGGRITWQATPRNKFAFSADFRDRCDCPQITAAPFLGPGSLAREAAPDFIFRPDNIYLVSWSSPVTNRLLLESTIMALPIAWSYRPNAEFTAANLIQVTSQNPLPNQPQVYRGRTDYQAVSYPFWNGGVNATYVTGAHAFKAGYTHNWGHAYSTLTATNPITSIRVDQATGQPNQFTVNSNPRETRIKTDREIGAYVQDRFTVGRVTLSGGLRYDHLQQSSPEVTLGPAPLLPNRNVTFPNTVFKSFHDLSPRLGAAYDVFGNGKTALKVTLNRYVTDESLGAGTGATIGSPQTYFQYTASRSWIDANGNFYPDCELANGAAQDLRPSGGDFCGAFVGPNANFGRATAGTVADDDVTKGFGNRGYNWEYSTSVQQELVPGRVAIDVGYFRRWYGNFTVTDNLVTSPSDYRPFSVVVPSDARLPTSGQTISGFLDVNPDKAALPTDNHVRRSSEYGKQYENWQGLDVIMNARLGTGTVFQGGFSTGRTVTDNCEVLAKVPEGGVTAQQGVLNALLAISGTLAVPFCHQEQPYLTQVKMLGTYTVPRIDVQLAGTFQSIPGPQVTATVVYPNTVIASSLGRNLSGNAPNVTVNVIPAGELYGDRLNQVDVRIGKILRFAGNRRVTASVDLYNLLDSSAVLVESTDYSAFRVPSRIVGARMLKFSVALTY